MLKTKRGRLWFIRCLYPIPKPPPDQDKVVADMNAMKSGYPRAPLSAIPAGGVAFRPLKQPLYDTAAPELKGVERGGKTLFHTSGVPGQHGYYWSTNDGLEVMWVQHQDSAVGFDSREDAEFRAFELTTIAPWLIGKLEIVKLKTRRLSDAG